MIGTIYIASGYLLIGFAIGFLFGSQKLLNDVLKEIENIKKAKR